jgi:hypothetical protein
MAQWSDASNTNRIEHSSWDVNLADFDPNYDATYDLEANCPMCRTRTTAAPDNTLARQLEQKYPITYAERRVEEEEDRGSRIGRNGFEGVMILIGNKHRLIRNPGDDNEHDWTFFVRTSRPDLIKEVHIYLVCSHVLLSPREGPTYNILLPSHLRAERLVSSRRVLRIPERIKQAYNPETLAHRPRLLSLQS